MIVLVEMLPLNVTCRISNRYRLTILRESLLFTISFKRFNKLLFHKTEDSKISLTIILIKKGQKRAGCKGVFLKINNLQCKINRRPTDQLSNCLRKLVFESYQTVTRDNKRLRQLMMYLFPALRAFWFLEKTALRENRVQLK